MPAWVSLLVVLMVIVVAIGVTIFIEWSVGDWPKPHWKVTGNETGWMAKLQRRIDP